MKKIKLYALCLMASVAMLGCSKYDDSELRGRVESLEEWQKSINSNIASLKSLITALEAKDFVTSVTPLTDGSGYVIHFEKSGAITVKHGEKGATPIIGTMQDTDGKYYWTVDGKPLLNAGAKVPVTGENGADGMAPQVRINATSGEWEISTDGGATWTSTGVKAQGDAIFAKDGIDYTTDPANVILTLADGTTKIKIPKSNIVTVGFDSYNTFYCSETDNVIPLVLPKTLKESDYNAITATISNENGTDMDIQIRSASLPTWGVEIIKPTFTNGVFDTGSAKIKVILPQDKTNYKALLKVTFIDKNGKESSVSRVVWFKADKDVNVIDNTTGSLSEKIVAASDIKQLSVIGSMSEADFAFIRTNLTSMELLDLSRLSMTELPYRAMAFYGSSNLALKTVILPDGLTTIGASAFAMCKNLQQIKIPKGVRTLAKWMFEGCISLEEIEIPEGVTEISKSAFYESGIKRITLPESVTTIGVFAFSKCNNLTSIRIPSQVTEISEAMFYFCNNLEEVHWHNNITSIGDDAFTSCKKLFQGKTAVIPSKVTTIGARAFAYTGMIAVTLPEGIQTISNSAFNGCLIPTIDLPSSISSLHATAFNWETATTVISRSTTVPEMPVTILDNNGITITYPMFVRINPSCILKRPIGADYTAWTSYFGGGIQDL